MTNQPPSNPADWPIPRNPDGVAGAAVGGPAGPRGHGQALAQPYIGMTTRSCEKGCARFYAPLTF